MALLMTGEHLEKLCRKFAAAKNHDDPTGTSRATTPDDDMHRRYVHRRDRDDGMVVFEAVLHPDEADIVSAALERIAKERCRARAEVPAEVEAAPGRRTRIRFAPRHARTFGTATQTRATIRTSSRAVPSSRANLLRSQQ